MIEPKKSLGQNFLRDEKILKEIIGAADLTADDLVIEVGPGEGALTKELVKYAGRVIAVEKDENLANFLKLKITNPKSQVNSKLKIFKEDILKINLPLLIEQNNFFNYKVIANIPYYITSPIIRLFLETTYPPTEMILMVQKEVAERICARPGEMSILAVSVQYYATPELLFYVPKEAFWPVPEVDSAVIKISNLTLPTCLPDRQAGRQESQISKIETNHFFKLVKSGFSAKRKTLANNLSTSLKLDKKNVEKILKKIGLNPNVRAQELGLREWKKLARVFQI